MNSDGDNGTLWRPFQPGDGLIDHDKDYFISSPSHAGRANLMQFLWQEPAGMLVYVQFGDGSETYNCNASGAQHLSAVWSGVADDSWQWVFRAVAIPDDRPVDSAKSKWIMGRSIWAVMK